QGSAARRGGGRGGRRDPPHRLGAAPRLRDRARGRGAGALRLGRRRRGDPPRPLPDRITAGGDTMTDRTIVVVGGTQGIGLELAKDVVARGDSVVITGRGQERVEQIAAS